MRAIVVAFGLAWSISTASAADQWTPVDDSQNGFGIDFPAEPATSKSLGSNKDGHVTPPGARYMAIDGDLAFAVIISDLRNSPIQPEIALDGAVSGLSGENEVVSDANIKIGGHDGRAMTVADATKSSNAQIFLANGRLYQTLVIGPKQPTPEQKAEIERFNKSLRFSN